MISRSTLRMQQPLFHVWVTENPLSGIGMPGQRDAAEGNAAVIDCVKRTPNLTRVVVCTSVGVEEDWPPVEFFKFGQYLLSALFTTLSNASFRDLTAMERAYRATSDKIDYLLVRPVGIGEDVKPVNSWVLQTKKYGTDIQLGYNMAKLDVARYMVEEAIHPTRHRDAVVIGNEKETAPSK